MAKKKISDLEEIQLSEMNGNEVLPLSKNGKSYRVRVSLVGEFIVDNFDIQGGGGGGSVSVVNNLESTSPSKALSANMGRVLDEKIASTNTSLEGVSSSITGVRGDVSNIQSIMNGQSQSIQKLWDGVNANAHAIKQLNDWHIEDIDALDAEIVRVDHYFEDKTDATNAALAETNNKVEEIRQELEDVQVQEGSITTDKIKDGNVTLAKLGTDVKDKLTYTVDFSKGYVEDKVYDGIVVSGSALMKIMHETTSSKSEMIVPASVGGGSSMLIEAVYENIVYSMTINRTSSTGRHAVQSATTQEIGDLEGFIDDGYHCVVEVSNSGEAIAHIGGYTSTYGYSYVQYVGGRVDICPSIRFKDAIAVFARTATYVINITSGEVSIIYTGSIGLGLSLEKDHKLSLKDNFRFENKGVINIADKDSVDAFMRTMHTAYCVVGDAHGNTNSNEIIVEVPLDIRTQYELPNKLNVGDMLLKRNGELHVIANGLNKDRVTITQDYYDDGSGSVVPVKHPDLATQPNVLPYKLAGNYVYEQLMAIPEDVMFSTSNGYVKFSIDAPKWEIEKPSILKATLMSSNVASVNEPQMCMPCIVSNAGDSLSVYVSDVLLAEKGSLKDLWLLLEYSSFDARGGYYYERSNEVVAEKGPTESKYNLYINVEDGYTWEINGKQYNTGLHKLSDEEVTHIITTSNIFGGIKSTLDGLYSYMKATLEGYTETRNARVSWSRNIDTGLWSCGLVYFYETYSGVYSLSYHLPMAAEAIANGEKVILELTNTY